MGYSIVNCRRLVAVNNIIWIICNSYTMPTRAVWNLLPEPEGGKGNKSHTARGGVV